MSKNMENNNELTKVFKAYLKENLEIKIEKDNFIYLGFEEVEVTVSLLLEGEVISHQTI